MARRSLLALLALAGALGSATTGLAAPVTSILVSPDITLRLGSSSPADVADEHVASDNLAGGVALQNLGPLPAASDVAGYALLSNGRALLCFEDVVELPGPVFAMPGDVVRFDDPGYSIEFDASANGVPDGVFCDAIAVDLATDDVMLSF